MTTKFSICSDSCVLIGASPINSFEDGLEGEVCGQIYNDTYESILRLRDWTFTRDFVEPPLLNKKSFLKYQYVYQFPRTTTVGLKQEIVSIVQSYTGTEFKIVGSSEIHTNEKDLVLNVKIKVDESLLPSDFLLALKYKLAAELAVPLTENTAIAQVFEQKYQQQISQAINNDLFQEPDTTYFDDPLFESWYG